MCLNTGRTMEHPAQAELGEQFKNFHSTLMSGMDAYDIERDLANRAPGFLQRATVMPVCTTKRGFLAAVPRLTVSGDCIVLLSGGRTPFILRQNGDHYRLIGCCYVHGIMNGEAFPQDFDDLEWISIR